MYANPILKLKCMYLPSKTLKKYHFFIQVEVLSACSKIYFKCKSTYIPLKNIVILTTLNLMPLIINAQVQSIFVPHVPHK